MSDVAKYCKAYYASQIKKYANWEANLIRSTNNKETQSSITDDDVLFLHENYTVTDGIFSNENIVFDSVTPEWKKFCDEILGYTIPSYDAGS